MDWFWSYIPRLYDTNPNERARQTFNDGAERSFRLSQDSETHFSFFGNMQFLLHFVADRTLSLSILWLAIKLDPPDTGAMMQGAVKEANY